MLRLAQHERTPLPISRHLPLTLNYERCVSCRAARIWPGSPLLPGEGQGEVTRYPTRSVTLVFLACRAICEKRNHLIPSPEPSPGGERGITLLRLRAYPAPRLLNGAHILSVLTAGAG